MKKKSEVKKSNFEDFYDKKHKLFLIIPALLFVLAMISIINTISIDGTPIYRDVSLKGGLSAIINVDTELRSGDFLEELKTEFNENKSLYIRYLHSMYFEDSSLLNKVYSELSTALGSADLLDSLTQTDLLWN